MRKRTQLKLGFLLTVLVIIVLAAVFIAPNIYFQANKGKVNEVNSLRTDLGLETIETRTIQSANLLDIFSKVSAVQSISKEIGKIQEYKDQKASISDNFNIKVSEYYTEVESVTEIQSYLNLPNIENVEFQMQKDPDGFIGGLWSKVRSAYIEYNSTADVPLRFQFEPETEIEFLTTEEKVGLLFGFALKGTSLTEEEQIFISEHNIGTIALFGHNISGQEQIKVLTKQIQKTSNSTPVLIATDQEGGTVKRLSWDSVGSAKQIAALSDDEACDAWDNRSNTLFESGVNWNLGTIGDVTQNTSSFIYPRVFSTDYSEAANEVAISTRCESIISTLKHWPGHGSTSVDTHMQLGVLSVQDEETWLATDNLPFQAGVDNEIETVMVGQLLMNWLNPDKPATLSKEAISYLRNDLKFTGAIVTDDLMMLTQAGYSIEDAVSGALLAGNDLLFVVNNDIPTQSRLYNIALELVTSGQISMEDLDSRVIRILQLRSKITQL